MLLGLHHIGVHTADIEKSIEFYKTLGLTLDRAVSIPGGTELAFLSVGSLVIELVQPADKSTVAKRGAGIVDHVAIAVKDIEGTIAELAAKGIPIDASKISPSTTLNAKNIFFDGPSGERIELFEDL